MALTHQETNGTTATEDYVEWLLFSLTSLTKIGSLLTSDGQLSECWRSWVEKSDGGSNGNLGRVLVFNTVQRRTRFAGLQGG